MSASMINFIGKYGEYAKTAATGSAIFPETILCAAALESGYAKSELSSKYNNFFGIKAQKGDGWTGKTVTYKTREQKASGEVYYVNAAFRHFDSPADSFKNYVKFITGPRYIKAGVTSAKSPVEQFEKIKAAGYATDVNYAGILSNMFNGVKDWAAAYPAAGSGLAAVILIISFFF
jgi:flagellum-specific peptidoglycan hydrolase FlgJ